MTDRDRMARFYRSILTIRRFEERVVEICKFSDDIGGVMMTCDGAEAAAVGVCENLRKDDYVLGTHRTHAHLIARGGDLCKMMAELYGKETGYCRGRGGQMHYQAPEIGYITASGIVGDTIAIAAGVGLAAKLKGEGQVVVSFFGDGATNTGIFHEGINLAAAWKLPVLFVCENNMFAVSTKITDVTAVQNLADRAVGYGMPGMIVNGMDVVDVFERSAEAISAVRNGEGPVFMECKTYRFVGHSALDPKDGMMYKDKKEDEEWRKRDPLKVLGEKLRTEGFSEDDGKDIEQQVRGEIDRAVEFAEKSSFPGAREITENLFVN